MSHQWMILAVVPCMVMGAVPANAATPFSRQVAAQATGTVRVSNVSGQITITAWDRSQVDVQGDYGPGVERIDVNSFGDDVEIRVVMKERNWRNSSSWGDGEARLQIKVPVQAELDASTVSGSISVRGNQGDQRLKSISGDVLSDVVGPDVVATTISGSVELTGTGHERQVRATSVSGDVRLRRMSGDIEARSTSGTLDIETSNASNVHAGVVSGSLMVRGTLRPEADVDLSAVSGSIRVKAQIPGGFRYDITTFSGAIRNCFGSTPEEPEGRRGWKPGTRLSGNRGDGKASIRARSQSGSVEICDR